jgi:hypothetical protein
VLFPILAQKSNVYLKNFFEFLPKNFAFKNNLKKCRKSLSQTTKKICMKTPPVSFVEI